ncbi:MAG: hypothetical protein PHH01_02030 [Patescibacteria group bacterium]|nr:hypothetical protein [Patescibacteria group bacterium]
MKYFWSIAPPILAVLTLGLIVLAGCSDQETLQPDSSAYDDIEDTHGIPLAQYWGDRIVSEAFYALNQSRSGGSTVSYHGSAMSDWNYVESDRGADRRVAWWIGSCTARGGAGGIARLKDWDGNWKDCHRGGYCRFFANLVLYRSSYGWGNGKHLVLPRSGTGYALEDVHQAQPGWILQSAMPHTAIVVVVYSYGLDVVDANWVGGNGNFAISRHLYTWEQLANYGFKAYNPWASPTLMDQNGPEIQCY